MGWLVGFLEGLLVRRVCVGVFADVLRPEDVEDAAGVEAWILKAVPSTTTVMSQNVGLTVKLLESELDQFKAEAVARKADECQAQLKKELHM